MKKEYCRGQFITLEGGEGAGKTTQLAPIQAYLQAQGITAVMTREPGGTMLGDHIRQLLLKPASPAMPAMAPDTELLLMFAARAEHIAQVIRPALARGDWVISDRFIDSSYAYQCGGRGIAESRMAALETWVLQGFTPDLTLWFDIEPALGQQRVRERGTALDRFEAEQQAFFQRVHEHYQRRAQQYPARIYRVDAQQSVSAVTAQVLAAIQRQITRATGVEN